MALFQFFGSFYFILYFTKQDKLLELESVTIFLVLSVQIIKNSPAWFPGPIYCSLLTTLAPSCNFPKHSCTLQFASDVTFSHRNTSQESFLLFQTCCEQLSNVEEMCQDQKCKEIINYSRRLQTDCHRAKIKRDEIKRHS